MSWTLVGSTSGVVPKTGDTTQNFALPGTPLEDDIVIIALSCDSSLETYGVTSGQSYTDIFRATTNVPGYNLAYKVMGVTPDSTVNMQRAVDVTAYAIQVWRGVDTSNVLDVTTPAVATGTSDSPDSPSITTVTDGALIFSFAFLDDDDATVSVTPTGYSNMVEGNTALGGVSGATVAFASKELASFGADDPSAWTLSNDQWVAATIALRPAATGSVNSVIPLLIRKRVM